MDMNLTTNKLKEQTNRPAVEDSGAKILRTPKYEAAYIKYGFTAKQKNGHDCVLCLETLSNECLDVR